MRRDDDYMSSNSDLRYTCEEYAREQWGPVIAQANEKAAFYAAELRRLEAVNAQLVREAEDGRAFRKLMAAIKDNPAAEAFWNKTMAMLRLVE